MIVIEDDESVNLSIRTAFIGVLALGFLSGMIVGGGAALTLETSLDTQVSGSQEGDPSDAGNTEDSSDAGDTGSQDDPEAESETVPVSGLELEGERTMGDRDAEVTMVYWGDFNCMYCYKFAQESLPDIRENFVEEGDLRIVYKNLITMGEDSVTLAKASQAAWRMVGESSPETYWRFHSQLHDDQKERKQNSQPVEQDILDTAGKVEGVNGEELLNRMEEISREEVTGDMQEAKKRGITGTPGFVVFRSGAEKATPITGAQPYSNFEAEINKLLEN